MVKTSKTSKTSKTTCDTGTSMTSGACEGTEHVAWEVE